jgi:hypothetical protein
MASTRNKNTQGDYNAEQVALYRAHAYYNYNDSHFYGVPQVSYFAGNGLIGMKTAHRNLSSNYCDIESQLFGIGSTNLVTPKPDVVPELIPMKSVNIADRIPMVMPHEFQPINGQRFMYLN